MTPSEGYTTHNLARGLQDTLICGEMFLVSIAHLYTFSYRPFTEEERREKFLLRMTPTDDSLTGPLMCYPTDHHRGDPKDPGDGMQGKRKVFQKKVTASNKGSSSIVSTNELEEGIMSTSRGSHQLDVNTETTNSNYDNNGRLVAPLLIPRQGGFRLPKLTHGSTTVTSKNNGMVAAGNSNRTMKNLDNQTIDQSKGVFSMLDRNFASSTAVRDFNESMPVIVLPSNFTPEKGRVALSRPSDRVSGQRE